MPYKKEIPSTGLLTIDLGAIQHNWLYLKKLIAEANASASCAAVVKANAYGLGVKPIALSLVEVGCKNFFVATLDEGEELRGVLGPKPRIFVLGGIHHGFTEKDFCRRWEALNLVPVLYSLECIERWMVFCRRCEKAFPCVLKVDTGMHRLGISSDELVMLLDKTGNKAGQLSLFNPVVLMSHLACADEPANLFNQEQLLNFRQAIKKMQVCFPSVELSLSNSSGVFLGDQFHFDLCRPGIALYGGNPVIQHKTLKENPMRQVVSLSLPVMQYRTISAGESVGYGKTFVAKKDTHLVTVFGGYADGIFRLLSNRAYGWCNGFKVPLVGRVSMDSITFDVTDLPARPDSIQIFETSQCLDALASAAKTISYELLTNLGVRYRREYINGSANAEVFNLLSNKT